MPMTTYADLKLPVDALARLAVAAGYNARGTQIDRVNAEHHLSIFLSILNRDAEKLPRVTIADAEQMMLEVFNVARGTPPPAAPALPAPRRCAGRVVGAYGVIERCGRPGVALRRPNLQRGASAQIIGKGRKERTIYFDTASWAAITAYLAARGAGPADFVFIRHDRNAAPPMPLSAAAGWRIVQRIIAASGLSHADITPHSFRHYVATKLYQATGDLGLTQTALGHSSPDTTRIYAQLDDAALRTAHARTFS